ncbi:MAG: PEP-CTERM sorting domain-containing protein [Candidatus Eisenbacteria bacterium]|uniref:PEP-CTERM sorting domain-containing protein n=1 Tax=Eiseniibacteriota bacterium TaxID=2212470 RepID=A0A937X8S5_UNCEI|nr:PEP-CTERM sorting domain-containing protein [Candidatus Eisenbacteria bacterium]
MKRIVFLLGVLAILAASAPPAHAAVFTLTDLNSVFQIDSAFGADLWTVDGVSQLYEQGFWFRIGDDSAEQRLGNFYSNGWVDPGGRTATLQFVHNSFTADIVYTLTGGTIGSRTSDVAETIRIINTGGGSLPMRFFQYCDFDLNGTPGDDKLWFPNANTVRQVDLGSGAMVSETVVTPVATRYEGDIFANTRSRLEDDLPTTLSNLPAPGGFLTGDVTWAFQWDRTLPRNGTFIISKDKHLDVVPEPGTLLLLGLGLVGAEVTRRRRKKA